MNLYYELLKKPVFTMEDARTYYHNIHSARSAVKRLLDQGLVLKIRRNLYTCKNGATGAPVANRFQIASHITKSSYISHHTAMEFYGLADQVFYEAYIGSEKEFKSFDFDDVTYRFVKPKIFEGVVDVKFSGGIRVTDLERTVVDSIKDMDRIAGIEEVISNIEAIHHLDEEKLMKYLDLYDIQFLYQKTGFILKHFQNQFALSDAFFTSCRMKAGKSTRYLSSDYKVGIFDLEWRLVIPDMIFKMKNGEMWDVVL